MKVVSQGGRTAAKYGSTGYTTIYPQQVNGIVSFTGGTSIETTHTLDITKLTKQVL